MQDLIQDYASDLRKLREAFDKELTATADELSKAFGVYAQRNEAALASFMEKTSARGLELEVSATARLRPAIAWFRSRMTSVPPSGWRASARCSHALRRRTRAGPTPTPRSRPTRRPPFEAPLIASPLGVATLFSSSHSAHAMKSSKTFCLFLRRPASCPWRRQPEPAS